MRRGVLLCCLGVLFAPSTATAALPVVTTSAMSGAAPLTVTLTATGDSPSYHWDFGDGTSADGYSVTHTFGPGRWTATATAADGEATSVTLESAAVSLAAAKRGDFGQAFSLRGALTPAAAGTVVALYRGTHEVTLAHSDKSGRFRFRLRKLVGPGPYIARTAIAASSPVAVAVRPQLDVSFVGLGTVGSPFRLVARVRPASRSLRVRVWKSGRLVTDVRRVGRSGIELDTSHAFAFRTTVTTKSALGYAVARSVARATLLEPNLQLGSRGSSVRALEQRLVAMHYALRRVDSSYDDDTYEAVLAFQKVHGLERTGRVDSQLWRQIVAARTPVARYPGNHVEVDKGHQVLFEVRKGKVALVVHISTGATGNTPLGQWHIYRRVTGFDWVLYYPTYFLRGFAIHGYPDVPAYPASHGCVRVPMWIAQRLYDMDSYGDSVFVY